MNDIESSLELQRITCHYFHQGRGGRLFKLVAELTFAGYISGC